MPIFRVSVLRFPTLLSWSALFACCIVVRVFYLEQGRRGPVRVTLLVNVWLSHKPAGISPLPARIAATLSKGVEVPALSFERPVVFYPVSIQQETPRSDGAVQREAQASTVIIKAPLGPKCMLELMVPTSGRLSTGECNALHSFALLYREGCHSRIVTREGGEQGEVEGAVVSGGTDLGLR